MNPSTTHSSTRPTSTEPALPAPRAGRRSLLKRLSLVAGGLLAVAAVCLGGACEARADASKYTISVEPVEVKAGGEATAKVVFTPGPKFKWNLEYPARLTIQGDNANVDVEQLSFRKGDFEASDASASLEVPIKGRMPGSEVIEAEARISVCNDSTCLIEKAQVRIPVDVVP